MTYEDIYPGVRITNEQTIEQFTDTPVDALKHTYEEYGCAVACEDGKAAWMVEDEG